MFTDARRYANHRKSFAIDCKRFTSKTPELEELELQEYGLLLTRLTGHLLTYNEYLKVLRSSGVYGLTEDGRWTNGFIITSKRFNYTIANSHICLQSNVGKLLKNVHRVEFGCLIFTERHQRNPIISLFVNGKSLFFGEREFDTCLSRLAKLETENVELYADEEMSGVVFSMYGVPSIYLAKLRLPDYFEPLAAAQAEKFYAYSWN